MLSPPPADVVHTGALTLRSRREALRVSAANGRGGAVMRPKTSVGPVSLTDGCFRRLRNDDVPVSTRSQAVLNGHEPPRLRVEFGRLHGSGTALSR
jgi:hypothetical protein